MIPRRRQPRYQANQGLSRSPAGPTRGVRGLADGPVPREGGGTGPSARPELSYGDEDPDESN